MSEYDTGYTSASPSVIAPAGTLNVVTVFGSFVPVHTLNPVTEPVMFGNPDSIVPPKLVMVVLQSSAAQPYFLSQIEFQLMEKNAPLHGTSFSLFGHKEQ